MISVGYASPGTVATLFHESLLTLVRQDSRITHIHSFISGPRITSVRNDIVREFLKTENEWLLSLDTDMVFQPDLLNSLLGSANKAIRPVVGGLCFGGGRVNVPFPTLYTLTNPKDNGGKITRVVRDYPKDALCKVDATGAACLLIHRKVLQEMGDKYKDMPDGYPNPHPWFAESVHQGHEFGEDWTFCMRLKQMGVPLYVNTAVKLGHVKTQNYNEAYYEQWRKFNG